MNELATKGIIRSLIRMDAGQRSLIIRKAVTDTVVSTLGLGIGTILAEIFQETLKNAGMTPWNS